MRGDLKIINAMKPEPNMVWLRSVKKIICDFFAAEFFAVFFSNLKFNN
jgi:hypothetical protein